MARQRRKEPVLGQIRRGHRAGNVDNQLFIGDRKSYRTAGHSAHAMPEKAGAPLEQV